MQFKYSSIISQCGICTQSPAHVPICRFDFVGDVALTVVVSPGAT